MRLLSNYFGPAAGHCEASRLANKVARDVYASILFWPQLQLRLLLNPHNQDKAESSTTDCCYSPHPLQAPLPMALLFGLPCLSFN